MSLKVFPWATSRRPPKRMSPRTTLALTRNRGIRAPGPFPRAIVSMVRNLTLPISFVAPFASPAPDSFGVLRHRLGHSEPHLTNMRRCVLCVLCAGLFWRLAQSSRWFGTSPYQYPSLRPLRPLREAPSAVRNLHWLRLRTQPTGLVAHSAIALRISRMGIN
jgi:hypothetical protein